MKINEILETKEFWLRYFWLLTDDFFYEQLEDEPISFKINDEYGLMIDTGGDMSYISLSIKTITEEYEIAWDDESHWIPFVFRLEELDKLINRICENSSFEKWKVYLLLVRFVGADNTLERERLFNCKKEMLHASNLFSGDDLGLFDMDLSKNMEDLSKIEAQWEYNPQKGWCYEGFDAYSLRNINNEDFPFDIWNKMLNCL